MSWSSTKAHVQKDSKAGVVVVKKVKGLKVLLFALYFSFSSVAGFCSDPPKEFLSEALQQVKEKESFLPLFDYVHWGNVFGNINVKDLVSAEAVSPSVLKEQYRVLFSDPKKYFAKYAVPQMKRKYPGSSPAEIKRREVMTEVEYKMFFFDYAKVDEAIKRIKNISFTLGKCELKDNGNLAQIELSLVEEETEKKAIVWLEKYDGQWGLPSLKLLKFYMEPKYGLRERGVLHLN